MFVLIYITIGLLGLYLFLNLERKKGKPLPGPKGWPFVGIGLKLTPENMFSYLSQYAERYGDVFSINMFGNTLVVLNSAEMVRKAFTADPYKKVMNDRAKTFYGESFLFGSQTIAFMEHAYGSKHGALRKGLTRALHIYGEGRKEFEELVHSELCRVTTKIESFGSQEFDFQDLTKRFLENIIAIMLSGHGLKTEENFKAIWDFDGAGDFFLNPKVDVFIRTFPFMKQIPSFYRDSYNQMINAKAAITKMFFLDAKDTYKAGVIRGIVDVMLEEQVQSQQNGEEVLFTDKKKIAAILEALAAGVVTTFTTLSSMFVCLLNYPEYQVKIQEEIDRVIGKDKLPAFADKAHCPMVEAVALETLRFIPILPSLLPHVCNSDIEFEGYDIPKNSMIIPNVFHIHRDEKVWGDPSTFRPERFLDDNGDILPKDHLFKKSWLPFGTGRRQCLGESLARSRMFLFATTLLQRWTFELPPGSKISCDPRSRDFDWNLNLRPKPYYCRVVPRE